MIDCEVIFFFFVVFSFFEANISVAYIQQLLVIAGQNNWHYFYWPATQSDMHTRIALRLQSSSHLGDTNGMIDTNVSRASSTADLHGSERAL